MEMKEWIKEQQRRYLDEPRLKELTEVMKQTRVLVRKKEYRKLTELVRRYRKSEDVITQVSCLLSASYLFPTPEKTAETARSELMEALKDTYFMEKNGSRLMDIRPEEAVPVSTECLPCTHSCRMFTRRKIRKASRNVRHRKKCGHLSGFWTSIGKRATCGNSATWPCILCHLHGMWHSGTGLRMIMTGLTG
ncbi:hypothetical protein ABHZ36_13625 [Bacteroides uniformis]